MRLKRNIVAGAITLFLSATIINVFAIGDTLSAKKKKHYFSVEAGGHRSLNLRDGYITPDTSTSSYEHDISTPSMSSPPPSVAIGLPKAMPGLYFVKVITGNDVFVRKLVIQ